MTRDPGAAGSSRDAVRDDAGARAALVAALKRKLATTPLSKVTVAGLAAEAGVTRQAFYYHFDDVYDAATWVFTTEVADHVLSHAEYSRWAEGFLRLLTYMRRNRPQVKAVLDSLTWVKSERFFHRVLRRMMCAIVAELEAGEAEGAPSGGAPRPLSDADRQFIIEHYTLTVLGHLLHWLAEGMKEEPGELVGRMEFVMRGQVGESLRRFRSGGPAPRPPSRP